MRTIAFALVFLLVAVAAREAAAGSPDFAKQAMRVARRVLPAQARAISAGDARALAETMGGRGLFLFPDGTEARPDTFEKAARAWMSSLGKVTVKVEKARYGKLYDGVWYQADLVVTGAITARWRISGLVGVDDISGDEHSDSDYRAQVTHIGEPVDDKDALAAAAAGQLPALGKIPRGDNSYASAGLYDGEPSAPERDPAGDERPDRIAAWSDKVLADPAVVLVGSAPKELITGPAAVAKKLAAWRKLKLATTDAVRGHEPSGDAYAWVVAHMTATFTVDGKPVVVPYRALLVYGLSLPVNPQPPTFAMAHFSIATTR